MTTRSMLKHLRIEVYSMMDEHPCWSYAKTVDMFIASYVGNLPMDLVRALLVTK